MVLLLLLRMCIQCNNVLHRVTCQTLVHRLPRDEIRMIRINEIKIQWWKQIRR